MNKEEIKEYLNRVDKLLDKLKGEDKETLSWLIYGYNQCAKLLNETQKENEKLKAEYGTKVQVERDLLKEENKQLKDLIDTILNFSFFKEECPLNFSFEDNSKEDKAQDVFYEDEYCENACNDNYRKCWLKYFEKMRELERDGKNE